MQEVALKKLAQKLQNRAKPPERHIRTQEGRWVPFHRAQDLAWDSEARIVVMSAGTQSGKTVFEPVWLAREIDRCGQGDYVAVTASFPLFTKKFLPEFLSYFEGLGKGRYWAGAQIIELADPTTGKFWAVKAHNRMWGRILLGSAQAPEGLESATGKAAVLDEAGMDTFSIKAYRAITRRMHIYHGRMLIGTTLYNLGWLKTEIIDRAIDKGIKEVCYVNDGEVEVTRNPAAGIDLIQYDSIVNPAFGMAEYVQAQATMPSDEFAMMYRGRVAQLRTLIYNCFDSAIHKIPHFDPPKDWLRAVGVDPMGEKIAGLWLAFDPDKDQLHVYREYAEPFGVTTSGHAKAMLALSQTERVVAWVGGGPSERQARADFEGAGLPLREPPISDVWVQINRVYALFKTNALLIHDNCEGLLDELGKYQRKKDKSGQLTEDILDKERFHGLDTLRYVVAWLTEPGTQHQVRYEPAEIDRRY